MIDGEPAVADPTALALGRLRSETAAYPADPFLLTVTATGAPHCSAVPVQWSDEGLIVPAPRHWESGPQPPTSPDAEPRPGRAQHEAAGRPVSLLYPPAEPGGYALIVDGTATAAGDGRLRIRVTRAVRHRRGAPAAAPPLTQCGSDCRPLIEEGASAAS